MRIKVFARGLEYINETTSALKVLEEEIAREIAVAETLLPKQVVSDIRISSSNQMLMVAIMFDAESSDVEKLRQRVMELESMVKMQADVIMDANQRLARMLGKNHE